MRTLRKPFLFLAMLLIAVCVMAELGMQDLLRHVESGNANLATLVTKVKVPGLDPGEVSDAINNAPPSEAARPGLAIQYMALLDSCVLFTVGLMALSLYVPESLLSRVQGCLTCLGSCLLILLGIVLIIIALLLLLLMVGLFLAAPFGTIAYLALFGFFDTGGAAETLGLLMLLKLAFCVAMVLANQQFLQNRGLVLIVATSLLANFVVAFLIAFPPSFLASITDSIAAIIVGILAVIWAIILLIGAIISLIRWLKVA